MTEPEPQVPSWAAIAPKVTAAGLAYALCVAVLAVLGDQGVEVSAVTGQSVSGFVMLLFAYLMPGR